MKCFNPVVRWTLPALFLCWMISVNSYSDGPPPGRTGAPGELTCFNGYCHNSWLVNSGDGKASLTPAHQDSVYTPGQTYQFQARISETGMQEFGFQVMAYSPDLADGVGEMIIIDAASTQKEENGNRQYILHDTAKITADSASWIFGWKAPENPPGDIVFYAAMVAANNNNNRSGDRVYTTQLSFPQAAPASVKHSFEDENFWIFAVNGQLFLSWELLSAQFLELEILDLQGRKHYELRQNFSPGKGELRLPVNHLGEQIMIGLFRENNHVRATKIRVSR